MVQVLPPAYRKDEGTEAATRAAVRHLIARPTSCRDTNARPRSLGLPRTIIHRNRFGNKWRFSHVYYGREPYYTRWRLIAQVSVGTWVG